MTTEIESRLQTLENFVSQLGFDAQGMKKTPFPVRTQTVGLSGLTRAFCVETLDPWKENRVRFYHPRLHDPSMNIKALPFAYPISAMGGFDDCGLSWVPPAGSTIALLFENGSREAPYYIGTTWQRDRGPGGSSLSQRPSDEYDSIYSGHRKGYLVGANDESQCLPPWNTESSNAPDIDSIDEFYKDADQQKRLSPPHIYGLKTPEKHMIKLVDGNPKCNRRWKRMEFQSGDGNFMIFKDDHIHYGGQWGHPSCGVSGSDVGLCSKHRGIEGYTSGDGEIYIDPTGRTGAPSANSAYSTDPFGKPIENSNCGDSFLGGHPRTPAGTKYANSQSGTNPYYKHENECRPLKGPGTPQNNKIDLPQSGVQIISIGGHTYVMDDSVEEPRGVPGWERSTKSFDFGCNDKFLGKMYLKSATGHKIEMSDIEVNSGVRGDKNKIELLTASGNMVQLNDHTFSPPGGKSSDTCVAAEKRGIHMISTSKHELHMCDNMNEQCSPKRKEGGVPESKSTRAYVQLITGYGLEAKLGDDNSQTETQRQYIQITHPQAARNGSDPKANTERGPHFMRFQGKPQGEPGVIFLRAGGHAIRSTYDMDLVYVGDKEKNPSDKFTYVSKMRISATEDHDFRYTGKSHIFFAEERILLMAGRDCPPKEGKKCKGPCLYPVIIARCPVICPLTGILHWTEKAVSERVFASAHHPCQTPPDCGSNCAEYFAKMAAAQGAPCSEIDATTLDQDEFETIGQQQNPNDVLNEDTF